MQSVDQSTGGILLMPSQAMENELSIVRDERYGSRGSMALQIPLYSINRKLKKEEERSNYRRGLGSKCSTCIDHHAHPTLTPDPNASGTERIVRHNPPLQKSSPSSFQLLNSAEPAVKSRVPQLRAIPSGPSLFHSASGRYFFRDDRLSFRPIAPGRSSSGCGSANRSSAAARSQSSRRSGGPA
jgi:hypothetical protein